MGGSRDKSEHEAASRHSPEDFFFLAGSPTTQGPEAEHKRDGE